MIVRPLTEYCTLNMGQSPDSKTYNTQGKGLPFYQGNADFGELHPITRVWCSAPVKVAEDGDILISVRAPIGAMNMAVERCCIGRGLAALTPIRNKCSKKFLYYALQSKVDSLIAQGTGSTFKAIGKKVLETTCIPAYSTIEQEQIAETIGHIDNTIAARRNQLALLDQLVKSRFIELFGMPGTDAFGWGLVPLGSTCNINPKKSLDSRLVSGAVVSFVPMPAVTEHGEIDATAIKEYDEVKTGFTYFAENDVLFAKITPCMENGKGAVAKGLHNGIGLGSTEFHVLRPISGKTDPYWIYTLTAFSQFRMDAASNMTGSAGQRRVPASFLENYRVSLPPIALQEQFAAFVKQTDKSKVAIQKALDEAQLLFDSLMQKYFG